ncbi:hypothetical protein TUM9754_16330 [Escherichia coli]|nr:hypothetical protein TUM9754_16330 [Escherichia coli]
MVRRSDIGNDGPYAIFERNVRFAGIHGTMRSKRSALRNHYLTHQLDWPHESPDNQYHLNK